jgi:hypothetical protein
MSNQNATKETYATRELAISKGKTKNYRIVRPPSHLKSFRMPDKVEIENLKAGSSVKLMFADPTRETGGERMFVNITKINEDGSFESELHNQPLFLPLKQGDKIEAHVTDIIEVWDGVDNEDSEGFVVKCSKCN